MELAIRFIKIFKAHFPIFNLVKDLYLTETDYKTVQLRNVKTIT